MINQELLSRITVNPNMAFGKPTIRGLRYFVEWLLGTLSSRMSMSLSMHNLFGNLMSVRDGAVDLIILLNNERLAGNHRPFPLLIVHEGRAEEYHVVAQGVAPMDKMISCRGKVCEHSGNS